MALAERQKVLVAAERVLTSHPREAAILGGVVRSTIDHDHFDMGFVSRYTRDILQAFELANVDSCPPSSAEIAMVKSRFDEYYRRQAAR